MRLARQTCPDAEFFVGNTLDSTSYQHRKYDTVICTVVLENVVDDLGILDFIKNGAIVIASVPNFDSLSHVRYFVSEADVRQRYAPAIKGLQIDTIPIARTPDLTQIRVRSEWLVDAKGKA